MVQLNSNLKKIKEVIKNNTTTFFYAGWARQSVGHSSAWEANRKSPKKATGQISWSKRKQTVRCKDQVCGIHESKAVLELQGRYLHQIANWLWKFNTNSVFWFPSMKVVLLALVSWSLIFVDGGYLQQDEAPASPCPCPLEAFISTPGVSFSHPHSLLPSLAISPILSSPAFLIFVTLTKKRNEPKSPYKKEERLPRSEYPFPLWNISSFLWNSVSTCFLLGLLSWAICKKHLAWYSGM